MYRCINVVKTCGTIVIGWIIIIGVCYALVSIRTVLSNNQVTGKKRLNQNSLPHFLLNIDDDGREYNRFIDLFQPDRKIRINRKGSWQCQSFPVMVKKKKSVYGEACFYSAHYDDRPRLSRKPMVRIQTVSSMSEILSNETFCDFSRSVSDDTASSIKTSLRIGNLMPIEVIRTGRGHRVDIGNETLIRYGQYQLSCFLPDVQEIPSHVSIILNNSNFEVTNLLPILRNEFNSSHIKVDELVICVPISFGHINRVNFINWIELNKMLGVTRVVIYNASLNHDIDPIFDYYRDNVVVNQIVPPVPDRSRDGVKLGSPAGLNDCLLRQMYYYRYVIVCDFDEVIVPRDNITLLSLLAKVKKNEKKRLKKTESHSFSVRNAFFLMSYPPDTKFEVTYPYLRYRFQLNYKAKPVLGKSILDPMLCLSVFNHYCYVPASNTKRISISDSIARVHHYKNLTFNTNKTGINNAFPDDIMLRYANVLYDKVQPVLDVLCLS